VRRGQLAGRLGRASSSWGSGRVSGSVRAPGATMALPPGMATGAPWKPAQQRPQRVSIKRCSGEPSPLAGQGWLVGHGSPSGLLPAVAHSRGGWPQRRPPLHLFTSRRPTRAVRRPAQCGASPDRESCRAGPRNRLLGRRVRVRMGVQSRWLGVAVAVKPGADATQPAAQQSSVTLLFNGQAFGRLGGQWSATRRPLVFVRRQGCCYEICIARPV